MRILPSGRHTFNAECNYAEVGYRRAYSANYSQNRGIYILTRKPRHQQSKNMAGTKALQYWSHGCHIGNIFMKFVCYASVLVGCTMCPNRQIPWCASSYCGWHNTLRLKANLHLLSFHRFQIFSYLYSSLSSANPTHRHNMLAACSHPQTEIRSLLHTDLLLILLWR